MLSPLTGVPAVPTNDVPHSGAVHTFVGPHTGVPPEHMPQSTVRIWSQLSASITLPQFLPSRVQNAVSVSCVHSVASWLFLTLPHPAKTTPRIASRMEQRYAGRRARTSKARHRDLAHGVHLTKWSSA